MEEVISALRNLNEPVPVGLELPNIDQVINVEEQLLISLSGEFREFLLTVSDVVYGSIEPVTVTDPQLHTYLPEVAAVAWSQGLPRNLIPLCESGNSYYCVNERSEVLLWQDGKITEKKWPSIWYWVIQVWINKK